MTNLEKNNVEKTNIEKTIEITNEYDRLNVLKSEIDILKQNYKDLKQKVEKGLVSDDERKDLNQILLSKEYEYGKIKDVIATRNGIYESPKVGSWIVTKGKFGYRRVKVERDENCGW